MATAKKLPSGSYRCLIFDRMEDGKRKYKSFTAPTKKEAEFIVDQYLMDKDKIKKSMPDYSLGESIINYCNIKSNVLSPATIREYKRIFQYRTVPKL